MALSRTATDGTGRVGQVLGGRYRLISPVGRGASGQVFVADDVVLKRRVAVKVLHTALAGDEVFLRRFRAEAQAAAALNHPHVMAVYDWGHDDEPYLVTEYLAGGSLRSMLDGGRTLSLPQTLLVGLEAARGLEYAHRRGFIHRDIKPANLLFDDEARLRIADFGLARALAEAAWTEPTGAVLGTARYASPEQARGETLDGRSDVYSLAIVMVEAGTGQVPFAADTALGTLMARVGQPLPVDPSLGPLCAALEAAGAVDADDRPDAASFVDMLMAVADQLDRPDPLPLAGTRGRTVVALPGAGADESDLTTVGLAGTSASWRVADDSVDATPLHKPTRADRRRAKRSAKAAARAEAAAEAERAARAAADREEGGPEADRVVARVTPASTSLEGGTLVLHSADLGELGEGPADEPVGEVRLFDQDAVDAAAERGGRSRRARRRRWPLVLLVLLLVGGAAAGALVWRDQAQVVTVALADLHGEMAADAVAQLEADGLVVGQREEFADETVPGEVLAQSPAPGTTVEAGDRVTLTVSLGPPPVAVPADLAGLSVADATARLAEVGLGIETASTQLDEDVPAGNLIGLAPDVPAELPKGSTVPVVVSDGPPPRTVPSLDGRSYDEAAAELGALGLVAKEQQEYNERVPEGEVITTNPEEGTSVPKGSEVTVRISLGPPLVPIPDVGGQTVAEAAAEIEGQGLCVSGTQGSPTRAVSGTVPAEGTAVERGSCVTIVTG